MGCSNFCATRNLDQLNYYLGYITRAEQEREYQAMQRAEARGEVARRASTAGADVFGNTIDAQLTTALVIGTLAVPVIAKGLVEGISIILAAKQASEM